MKHDSVCDQLVSVLKTLADANLQKNLWPKGKGKPWESYLETNQTFYEIYELVCEYDAASISEQNKSVLRELYQVIDKFNDDISEEELADVELMLKNPRWKQIQEKSAKLLSALENEEAKK